MLRKVLIYKGKTIIFKKEYGKSLPEETINPLIESLRDYLRSFVIDIVDFMQIINFKLSFATFREYDLLFLLICDPTDRDDPVKDEIEFLRHNFLEKFRTPLTENVVDPTAYAEIQKDVTVSKTTITKLIKEEEIPTRHIPTITGYISEISVGDFLFYLWDLAGQVKYAEVWAQFMRGSDVIILITDSTEQNVYESRFFVELSRKEAPYARFAVVANKQDLPGALSVEQISDILDCGKYGYKNTPLVAIDVNNRIPVVKVLAETAATSAATIAPFQTLEDRKELLQEVQHAIEKGFLKEAAKILDEIAILSELKGDQQSAEYYKSNANYVKTQSESIEMQLKQLFKEVENKIQSHF
jgi:ADP-ribosylation factor-like protein 8